MDMRKDPTDHRRYTIPRDADDEGPSWRVQPGAEHGAIYSPERLAAELLILSRQVTDLGRRQIEFEDEIRGGVSSVRKWILGMIGTLIMSATTILMQAGVYQERIANMQRVQDDISHDLKSLRETLQDKGAK